MKRSSGLALAAVALLSAATGFTIAQLTSASWRAAAQPTPAGSELRLATPPPAAAPGVAGLPDFADIAERANRAVVRITSTTASEREGQGRMPQDPYHWFFGPGRQGPQRSLGTGFVITDDGYIFTNYHVVEDAKSVTVELDDEEQTRLPAKVIGQDPETDIALIKVEPKTQLPTIPLGDSERVRPGEWVCAIGNPLQYAHTVTVGVISAKGRRLDSSSSFESYLQTDAAINFGNSGGPLLNTRGEVIGINTAIAPQGQNIGFAVPINMAKDILPQLRERGRVVRGYLGVRIQPVEADFVKPMGLPSREGALVADVEAGEAGDKAGLKAGDVIVSVDGAAVAGPDDLVRLVAGRAPGQSVALDIYRNAKKQALRVVLGERKSAIAARQAPEGHEGEDQARLGITASDLTERVRERYRIEADVDGVAIIDVDGDGPNGDGTLQVGDVVLEVARQPVRSVSDLEGALRKVKPGDEVLLYVARRGARLWLSATTTGERREGQ